MARDKTRKKPQPKKAGVAFKGAIEAAEHLRLLPGLRAITKGEGKGQIQPGDGTIVGSVRIDEDCRATYPNHHRWDYVIGLVRSKRDVAVFVEVHSAETCEVSTMERKLDWLLDFLRRDRQAALAGLPRELHWVASGRVNIPRHLPQYRRLSTTLRAKGLVGPARQLRLA